MKIKVNKYSSDVLNIFLHNKIIFIVPQKQYGISNQKNIEADLCSPIRKPIDFL